MNCIECSFDHRDGKFCRSCMVRGQYMSEGNIPLCCEKCEYLTEHGECVLFKIENEAIRYETKRQREGTPTCKA